MRQDYPLMIDAYSHILPPRYKQLLEESHPRMIALGQPPLWDLEHRFRLMDKFDGLVQVLTVSLPSLEEIPN
jgi:hypothetical protein